MERQTEVVLLGDSMMMDGIAVSLENDVAFTSARLDPMAEDLFEVLGAARPDFIVFELDTPWSHRMLRLLKEQPGTLLLGLDLACSRVIVMNSHQRLTKSMEDLYRLFQEEVQAAPRT